MSIRRGTTIIAGNIDTSDKLGTDRITNCITQIPQDIKLELNEGTLTLKAGSKVYIPNGVDIFDTVTLANDISRSDFTEATDGQKLIFLNTNNSISYDNVNLATSGTTAPASTEKSMFYNTADNTIKYYNLGTVSDYRCSLPIGIITVASGVVTSIDQVFNGFGYIGSAIFVLPKVTGLQPDGFNNDGSLKHIELTTSNVLVKDWSGSSINRNNWATVFTQESIGANQWFVCDKYSDITNVGRTYVRNENITYFKDNDQTIENAHCVPFAIVDFEGGKVKSFRPAFAFHALDYNDSEYIAHNAMPSGRRVKLTLGASGSTYTAPADGYIFLHFGSQAKASCYIKTPTILSGINNVNFPCIYAPVQKGDVFTADYSGGTPTGLYFVYTNGSK